MALVEAKAEVKFVPLIMSFWRLGVQIVQRVDLNICVITQYADEADSISTQEQVTAIRSQASKKFLFRKDSACRRRVHWRFGHAMFRAWQLLI
jgi:hypothetical protein